MEPWILEACVDSVESAFAAIEGGANRLELCGNLMIGGTTPSEQLFQTMKRKTDIAIRVLIRPRSGDFCYTEYEFEVMKNEVIRYRELGAEGVVIGILKPDGTLDLERMKELITVAGSMHVTLHRAFDMCVDPYQTLDEACTLGIDTILTSGQENTAVEGKEVLRKLVELSRGRITILVGGGVNASNIRMLSEEIGTHAFHMSGKEKIESMMQYRRTNVVMGLPGMNEYEIIRTKSENIRDAVKLLIKDNLA